MLNLMKVLGPIKEVIRSLQKVFLLRVVECASAFKLLRGAGGFSKAEAQTARDNNTRIFI